VIVFPNCKINLGLRILGKRSDGYHDLETVFYPLPFCDILEVIHSTDDDLGLSFSTSGSPIEGNNSKNLCVKAYELLQKYHPALPGAKVHLHKVIPSGAGLGGGSADGAFTLKLLNAKFDLQLSNDQLNDYALQLGSDCPFFILNKPSLAEGRGEILETLQLDLSHYKFLIVNPAIHINTAEAFAAISPSIRPRALKEIIQQPIDTWKHDLINDFEESAFRQFPEIEAIKTRFYDAGALYASMSGTGSTVYGIFTKDAVADHPFPPNYFLKELNG